MKKTMLLLLVLLNIGALGVLGSHTTKNSQDPICVGAWGRNLVKNGGFE
jgi:hypothetical protein